MITVNEMNKIYNDTNKQYDDIDTVVDKVSALFIKHKTNDYMYGFPHLLSIVDVITNNNVDIIIKEQKIKEFKMLITIITDEIAVLSKIQYGIYNLCCHEQDFFKYLNHSISKHMKEIVKM